MKTSQLTFYLAAAADRAVRDACLKAAMRSSRLLRSAGALRASELLLNGAARLFPVGARGDFGYKDLRIFGARPEELIAEFAAYLERQGRNPGRAPMNQPPEDYLAAQKLMCSRGIYDLLSKLALASPLWCAALSGVLLALACFFAAVKNAEAAGLASLAFLLAVAAAALGRRLKENFLFWMTMRLFYAASRKIERDRPRGGF